MNHSSRALDKGATIRHRILDRLRAAGVDFEDACRAAGCPPSALLGEGDLLFADVVEIASIAGCSPAAFFDLDGSDTPSDTLRVVSR